ncbi:hypothetical protein BDZ91DRAFT_734057, partial [Kalaharituber pfeilii]
LRLSCNTNHKGTESIASPTSVPTSLPTIGFLSSCCYTSCCCGLLFGCSGCLFFELICCFAATAAIFISCAASF